jgi:hypothetical protein
MGVDIQSSPLIPGSTLVNKVIRDALALILQDRVRNATAGQYGLIVSMNVRGTHTRDSHHSELVSKSSQVFAAHCFIATNSEPKELDLQLACFIDNQ